MGGRKQKEDEGAGKGRGRTPGMMLEQTEGAPEQMIESRRDSRTGVRTGETLASPHYKTDK